MPRYNTTLSQERLKELLHYDPETGVFQRKVSTARCVKIGEIAGWYRNGYMTINIDYVAYRAHRLAWLYVYGQWPVDEIDHRNGIKDDNRLANLRECSHAENGQNLKLRKDSTSGLVGVRWYSPNHKWLARIGKDGKRIHLGYFPTKAAAHAAYCEAKRRLHTFQPEIRLE